MDDLYELAGKHKTGFVIAFLMFIARYRYTKHRTFFSFISGMLVSATSAMVVGLLIYDYINSIYLKNAIIGVASFMADDLFFALKTFSEQYRKNPEKIFELIKKK